LGAVGTNDLVKIIKDFGPHIHFLHLRNVSREEDGRFYEAAHLDGSIPMPNLIEAIVQEQLRRQNSGFGEVTIPIRPDHGHVLLEDKKRKDEFYSGYSLMGGAIGMAELYGLEKGIRGMLLKLDS